MLMEDINGDWQGSGFFCEGGSVRWRINTQYTGLHTGYYKNLESKQLGWFPVI